MIWTCNPVFSDFKKDPLISIPLPRVTKDRNVVWYKKRVPILVLHDDYFKREQGITSEIPPPLNP